jgi:hypothetical protein
MDIKVIAGFVGLIMTFGGLFVQVGTVMNRLEVLEAKSTPDITPIKQELADIKEQIAVLRTKVEQQENPLSGY